jgi:predicted AAA+ superfamily ATPase
MVPRILIIGSLPESDAEAGGERGKAALRRLEKVFGRVQSPWLPASGDETYEIIRRRLFQPLDAEGEKAREEIVKAFHDLYRKNPAEFPPEAKEKRYEELLRLSYPIHPELFDRLSKDWASLEKFQRTRGVLRFMANVVGVDRSEGGTSRTARPTCMRRPGDTGSPHNPPSIGWRMIGPRHCQGMR